MTTQARTLVQNTALYTVLGFLPMVSGFLLLPVYATYLPPAEMGIVGLATLLQAYLTLFIDHGLQAAASRYYFIYKSQKRLTNALLSTTLLLIVLTTLLLCAILYSWHPLLALVTENPAFSFERYGVWVLIATGFQACYTVLLQYYRDSERIMAFATLSVGLLVFSSGGTLIGVIGVKSGAEGYWVGRAAGVAILMTGALAFSFSQTGLVFRTKFIKPLYRFGFPIFLYALVGVVVDNLDRKMLAHHFDLSDMGRYHVAFTIASVVGVLVNSMQAALSPTLFTLYEKLKDPALAEAITHKLNRLYHGMGYAALAAILLTAGCTYPALWLLNRPEYLPIMLFVPLLAVAFIGRFYYIVYSMPLFFYQQTRTLPFVKLFSLAAGLVAYTVLIPIWGLAGVCLSVVVIKVVEAFGARAATLLTGTDSVGVYSLNRLHVLVVATLFLLLLPIIKTDLPLSLGAYYGVISGLMLIPAVIGGLRLMRAQLPKVMLR